MSAWDIDINRTQAKAITNYKNQIMYNYLAILQDNSMETRKVQPIQCELENLFQEVVQFTGYKDCSSIANISEVLRNVDWSLTVIDLKTYQIVE